MISALIVISGFPATGKSTLANGLGAHFGLPFMGKDQIKELIFDTLKSGDRAWSQRVGASAYEILLNFAETLLKSRQSVIIESNFKPELDSKRFAKIRDEFNCFIAQIHCDGNRETIVNRFVSRASSDLRHPGHVEMENREEFISTLRASSSSELQLDCPILRLNTTDFSIDNNMQHSIDFLQNFFAKISEAK